MSNTNVNTATATEIRLLSSGSKGGYGIYGYVRVTMPDGSIRETSPSSSGKTMRSQLAKDLWLAMERHPDAVVVTGSKALQKVIDLVKQHIAANA